ncbi:MAG: hypothetical protein J6X57_01685 [Bacteroidales bacterium]|nr:hypothetical protein [Bacteroidales bacterium]
MAFASCAKVEFGNPRATRDEISFSTTLNQETKGDATLVDLTSDGNGWGVYAYYTQKNNYASPGAAAGIIFNNRQVRWDDGNNVWDYSLDANHKKEYWPMDPEENVSFFAYGPWADYHGAASVDPDEGPQVTYTASTDLSNQKDLLWGTSTSGLPHRNVHMDDYADSKVDMHFRHAPAKMHFTINSAAQAEETGTWIEVIPSPIPPTETPGAITYGTQRQGRENINGGNRDLYYATRTLTITTTRTFERPVTEKKILLSGVEMENFLKNGVLHLDNPEAFIPYWTSTGNEYLNYSFGISQMTTSIIRPQSDDDLKTGWGTVYEGVDNAQKQLLPGPNNNFYLVPKEADTPGAESKNIKITVSYHNIGLSTTQRYTKTTTVTKNQRVLFYRTGTTYYYKQSGSNNYTTSSSTAAWEDTSSSSTESESAISNVSVDLNFSEDNGGSGWRAEGSINTDIIGGRNYTINLYLDGRELNLTVIPQPWDLQETVFDYNSFVNPVIQSLTYDSDFVYQVINDNVYINNRMGKFYFKLGSGMYLYWQASLIGDDAFAFTDENGEYLRNEDGSFKTAIRGNIGDDMNYIYVKAINTAAQVTSKAKLRIYLFNSENRAVVALPKDNWLFVSSTYIDQDEIKRVQEWSVVQSAN